MAPRILRPGSKDILVSGRQRRIEIPNGGSWGLNNLPSGVLVFAHELRTANDIGGVADGARVSTWTDRGPANDPLTSTLTNRPIYRAPFFNGRPILEFDADLEDRFMVGLVNRSITHLVAIAKVRKPNTNLGNTTIPAIFDNYRGLAGLNGYDGAAPLGHASLILTGESGLSRFSNIYSVSTYRKDGVDGSPSAMDANVERMTHRYQVSRSLFDGYPLVIGRDRNVAGAAFRWRGSAQAFFGLNAPSAGDLANLEAYTAWYSRGDICCFTGDSLAFSYGVNGNESISALLDAAWNGTIDVPNYAIPGQGVGHSNSGVFTTMIADDPAKIGSLPRGRPHAALFIIAGTNDLANGDSAATVEANIWTYVDARVAEGWTVYVCTVIDRTDAAVSAGQAAFDAKRATLNTGLRTNAAAHRATIIDLAADARLGANGASAGLTWFQSDKVHLKAVTYSTIIYPLVKTAVETLFAA